MDWTDKLVMLGMLLGMLILYFVNSYFIRKRKLLQELDHRVEFAIKFEEIDDYTGFTMLLFQYSKEQSKITGSINSKGQIIRLTTINDFIYEFYTGAELEQLILILYNHYKEHPGEPFPWPLDNINCSIMPFDMNS